MKQLSSTWILIEYLTAYFTREKMVKSLTIFVGHAFYTEIWTMKFLISFTIISLRYEYFIWLLRPIVRVYMTLDSRAVVLVIVFLIQYKFHFVNEILFQCEVRQDST